MTTWLVLPAAILFLVVGLAGLWRGVRAKHTRVKRVLLWAVAFLIGGASALMLNYQLDERTRIIGFPLPAAAFQQSENGLWADFVGPLTGPFMFANAVVNTGVVLYVLSVLEAFRRRDSSRSKAARQ